jgi:hypothetical protein
MNSGKRTGRVLLGGRERKLDRFRQISAHVKQVCQGHGGKGGGCHTATATAQLFPGRFRHFKYG